MQVDSDIFHGRGIDLLELEFLFDETLKGRGEADPPTHPTKPSIPGLLYLTTHYPIYYGRRNAEGRSFSHLAIFQIDGNRLDVERLFPDEDYLDEIATSGQLDQPWDELLGSTKPNPKLNPRSYRNRWSDSLRHLGNFCTDQHISFEMITSVILVRRDDDLLNWLDVDERISVSYASTLKSLHWSVLDLYRCQYKPDPEIVNQICPSATKNALKSFEDSVQEVLTTYTVPPVLTRPDAGWDKDALLAWASAFFVAEQHRAKPPGFGSIG